MTIKLIQKRFFKGSREFEIVNDVINVRIKTPFKQEKITVGLGVLDPEPVINTPCLEFYGHAESGPLLSLFLNKPNTEEFNAFVVALQQQILASGNAVAGFDTDYQPAGIAANVFDEPPDFDEFDYSRPGNTGKPVDAAKVESSIRMLEQYVDNEEIRPLLCALEALKAEPQDDACMEQVVKAFNDLGIVQGAVLTYAPYIAILLMDDPYADQ